MALFELPSFEDIVCVKSLMDSGELAGEFICGETDPTKVWFREKSGFLSFFRLDEKSSRKPEMTPALPWRQVEDPKCRTRRVEWPELFRGICPTRAPASIYSSEVVAITPDRSLATGIVADHFRVRQGECSFSGPDKTRRRWFVRIISPSAMILEKAAHRGNCRIFNLFRLGGAPIFVERGTRVLDLPGRSRLTLPDGAILLVQSDGAVESASIKWNRIRADIEVEAETLERIDPEEDLSVNVEVTLRDGPAQPARLWIARDMDRLRKIASMTSPYSMRGIGALFTSDGRTILLDRGASEAPDGSRGRAATTGQGGAEPGIREIFTDSFDSFCRISRDLYIPRCTRLQPQVDEIALLTTLGAAHNEFVILTIDAEGLIRPEGFPKEAVKGHDTFLRYFVREALHRSPPLEVKWAIEPPGDRVHPVLVDIDPADPSLGKALEVLGPFMKGHGATDTGGPADHRTPDGNKTSQGLSGPDKGPSGNAVGRETGTDGNRRLKRSGSTRESAHPEGSEKSQHPKIMARLKQIDTSLARERIDSVSLWTERASLSGRLGNKAETAAAALTSAAAAYGSDPSALLTAVLDVFKGNQWLPAQIHKDLSPLFTDTDDEEVLGSVLGAIHESFMTAEFHYSLLLYFGVAFGDRDVFDRAVKTMTTGYVTAGIPFLKLEDALSWDPRRGVAAGQGCLSPEPPERIAFLLSEFMAVTEKFLPEAIGLMSSQFRIILSSLDLPYEAPPPPGKVRSAVRGRKADAELARTLTTRERLLSSPASSKVSATTTTRWLASLDMKSLLKEPVENFITGDLFRPVFTFGFKAKSVDLARTWHSDFIAGTPPGGLDMERIREGWKQVTDRGLDASSHADYELLLEVSRMTRTILEIVTEYGPDGPWTSMVLPPLPRPVAFQAQILNCDIVRLAVVLGLPLNRAEVVRGVLACLPDPAVANLSNFLHFRDAAENLLLCLAADEEREFGVIEEIAAKALSWIAATDGDRRIVDECLTLIAYAQALSIMKPLGSEELLIQRYRSRRRSLWAAHAHAAAKAGLDPLRSRLLRSLETRN